MPTIVKRKLSGSADGQSVSISATAGGVSTIHTGPSGTSITDEVWLYAHNGYSQSVDLILEWGVSSTNAHIVTPIPSRDGMTVVVPGFVIQGSGTAPVIYGHVAMNGSGSFAASSSLVTIQGFVNRITQ